MLTRLAERGLLAVSFDPPGHGRRGDGGDPLELRARGARVLPPADVAAARDSTVLESLRVLDWADKRFGVRRPLAALGACRWAGTSRWHWPGIDERISARRSA